MYDFIFPGNQMSETLGVHDRAMQSSWLAPIRALPLARGLVHDFVITTTLYLVLIAILDQISPLLLLKAS